MTLFIPALVTIVETFSPHLLVLGASMDSPVRWLVVLHLSFPYPFAIEFVLHLYDLFEIVTT